MGTESVIKMNQANGTSSAVRKIAVMAPEKHFWKGIPNRACLTAVDSISEADLSSWSHVFVAVSMHLLPAVGEFITAANSRRKLSGVFVRVESESQNDALPQFLNHIGVRSLRNMMVHMDSSIPHRVLNAFCIGAENELIARAVSLNDDLFVVSCSAASYQLPFASIRGLRGVSREKKNDFRIASDGSFLHWPSEDIHINLESIRSILDKKYRRRRQLERIHSFGRIGEAVRLVRLAHDLTQSDVPGLSDRQIRRIEHGDRLTLSAAKDLAAAHDMSANDYLNELARFAQGGEDKRLVFPSIVTGPSLKLADIEGIGKSYAAKLKTTGVVSQRRLLSIGSKKKGRKQIAASAGISEKRILTWVNKADLARVRGVGGQYAELLEAAGVDTIPDLASRNATNLHGKLVEANARKKLVRQLPAAHWVSGWVAQAKKLKRIVEY